MWSLRYINAIHNKKYALSSPSSMLWDKWRSRYCQHSQSLISENGCALQISADIVVFSVLLCVCHIRCIFLCFQGCVCSVVSFLHTLSIAQLPPLFSQWAMRELNFQILNQSTVNQSYTKAVCSGRSVVFGQYADWALLTRTINLITIIVKKH